MVHTVNFANERTVSDYIHVPTSISALPGEYLRYFLLSHTTTIHCQSHTKQWLPTSSLFSTKWPLCGRNTIADQCRDIRYSPPIMKDSHFIAHPSLIVCLKHFWGYVIHWVGNLTEEKSLCLQWDLRFDHFCSQRKLKIYSSNFSLFSPAFNDDATNYITVW